MSVIPDLKESRLQMLFISYRTPMVALHWPVDCTITRIRMISAARARRGTVKVLNTSL